MNAIEKEQKQKQINLAIEEYLNTSETERSLTKLGEKYGVKRQTLSKYLKLRGYEVINYQNRCRIYENVFDTIDTEENAYWLGFIYADGNISSTGNRFEINLSVEDLDHMIKLKNFLNLETEIRFSENNGNPCCRIAVRNKNLWEQLNDKGCTPCKSLTLLFPDKNIFTQEKLVYDFIRGYVDGDGSLGCYPKNNSITTELSIVGTESFLISIMKFLKISGYIRNKSSKNFENKSFSLQYSSVKARKIARLLYKNATIYLDRKYNIYKLFCHIEEESSRRKSSKNGES